MQSVEASAMVPLSPEKTWDFFWEDPQRTATYLASSVTLEDFEIRADGTPRYRMVQRIGPLPRISWVSDYEVFDRPRQHVNKTLESPLGGRFYGTFEPTAGGTKVTWRWDVEPQNLLVRSLLPVLRPVLAWSLRRDLNAWTKAAADRLA
ncbi:SRPBCC family protein [Blastococcus deserti]|uniref:SRPBCC family protein n=1 Tax=Blastococcus deserti TaxID=2259033 RepID=A0ABW4X7N2_9ACTN